MGGILNGLSLHGGIIPYGATFFVFSDYMRPALRLAAMMKQPVILIYTHDSIFVGEDGPTHQAVEQLASLRTIPGMTVIRPADAAETATAWIAALENTGGPTVLALTRQKLPVLDRSKFPAPDGVKRGAYTLLGADEDSPDVLLIASGSEVHTALGAAELLSAKGKKVRVVNMASWELFDRQDSQYRDEVLPPSVTARVAVEAGVRQGWERYVGSSGAAVTIDRFGASAPYKALVEKFGFTAENVASHALALMGK